MIETEIRYTEEVQRVLLEYIISNESAFVRCQNILKPEYWDGRLKKTCRYILDFASEYAALPTPEMVKAETGISLQKIEGIKDQHIDWFLETIESFCRHKAMEILLVDGLDLIAKGHYSELERRSKENMLISLQNDLGTNYFDNPLERLHRMRNRTNMTSTGWEYVDKILGGGINRGELTFFCGGPGTGKSLFLQNLGLNWMEMGLNVIYITLELAEDLVGLRYDTMITSRLAKQVFRDMEGTALEVSIARTTKKMGSLFIKKMPEAGTSVNDIRAYVKEYEIQMGYKPDVLLVDYLDLLYPNNKKTDPSNLFVKDKYTSEELRALSAELNTLTITASQLNRESIQEADLNQAHIAGGISKINTADNVIAIYTSATMKERGEYQLQFLKTRSSAGVGQRVYLNYDNESLRITSREDVEDQKPKTFSNIKQDLQNRVHAQPVNEDSENPIPKNTANIRSLMDKIAMQKKK